MQTRRDASLLIEHGHHDAQDYTLPQIWTEARLVRDRIKAALADQAVMMQAVVIGAISDPKYLKKFLKELTDGD